jgi:hypothetical protein
MHVLGVQEAAAKVEGKEEGEGEGKGEGEEEEKKPKKKAKKEVVTVRAERLFNMPYNAGL